MHGIITLKNKIMIATHKIQAVTFDKNFIILQIDGKTVKASLENVSPKLKAANDFQRQFYKVSPSGYGLHWPLIDEDLSVDALLKSSL